MTQVLAGDAIEAIGLPVLGAVMRDPTLTLPERHLGLVQAVEHPDLERAISDYAAFLRANVDLNAIRHAASSNSAPPPAPGQLPLPPAQRIAIAPKFRSQHSAAAAAQHQPERADKFSSESFQRREIL